MHYTKVWFVLNLFMSLFLSNSLISKSLTLNLFALALLEITKKNINIYEVPIIIDSRRYNEGKKVKISDFFVAIYSIFKWRLLLLFNK